MPEAVPPGTTEIAAIAILPIDNMQYREIPDERDRRAL